MDGKGGGKGKERGGIGLRGRFRLGRQGEMYIVGYSVLR